MTNEQILRDLKTDRVKKVIVDCDFSAEIDDQYAFAYCLGSDKMEVLAVNAAAHFSEPDATETEAVMLLSWAELNRVLVALGIERDEFPAFQGARSQITNNPGRVPTRSDAALNIIDAVKKVPGDEIIYILVTGPCTNVVSACMIDPSLMDRICVLWLGGIGINYDDPAANRSFHEWNLCADFVASQLLFNMDIPLVYLPASPHGSADIVMGHEDLAKIEGDSKAAVFFRKTLMLQECKSDTVYYSSWKKVMCDFAAPAIISCPESMNLTLIPAPVLCDDRKFAVDSNRRKIICGDHPNSQMIVDDAMIAINNLVQKARDVKIKPKF